MYKKRYRSRSIQGKLRVCRYLSREPALRKLVPHTTSFTWNNLSMMMSKYHSVYIKYDVGSQGIGVNHLKQTADGYVLYSIAGRRQIEHRFSSLEDVYRHLKAKKKRFIIQKTVSLDQVSGRPYDIRAMVQRKPGGAWTCTGYLVKVGSPDKIVNNYYQGGKIWTLEQLLRRKGMTEAGRSKRKAYLNRQAIAVSKALSRKRAGMHEMGIDFAFDLNQRLWILEVNSNHPQFYPLRKIDPAAYWRMRSYGKSYGRNDA